MLIFGLQVKTVNIEINASKHPTFSPKKLLQFTKLAITLHLYTKMELKVHAFTSSNVPASHITVVIH